MRKARVLFYAFQSISCHFASSECEYIDVKGSSQQFIEDEIKELIKEKLQLGEEDLKDYALRVRQCDLVLLILLVLSYLSY